ncbi:hypothetical protein G4B88_008958, partial [Cannabis sativa]
ISNLIWARYLFDVMPDSYLFDEMSERNSVKWDSMIRGYTENVMLNEACLRFIMMISASFVTPSLCIWFVKVPQLAH